MNERQGRVKNMSWHYMGFNQSPSPLVLTGSVINSYSYSILPLLKDFGGEAHMRSKNSSIMLSSPEYVDYTSKLTYPTHPLIFQPQSIQGEITHDKGSEQRLPWPAQSRRKLNVATE